MSRKAGTESPADRTSGQHLSLAVAAHLARTQLVPDPPKRADAGQLGDLLNAVAQALARTAPLQVSEAPGGERRPLSPLELEGAVATRGATLLVLKDGRTLAGVSIRRADLSQAIALLKALGLPPFTPPPPATTAQKPAGEANAEALRARCAEIERLLTPPLLPGQVERAKSAAVWIARHAAQGRVANLSMQLMSALHETRGVEEIPGGFRMALARLRAALEEARA